MKYIIKFKNLLILMKKYNWLYLMFMMMSSLFMIFLNNFYSMWIFMELNLLIFITLIILNSNFISDKSMKYYLMNSFSSMNFLFFFNLNLMMDSFYFLIMINFLMLMKLGMFPFHYWFIDMLVELNWDMLFLLISWQKLIPLMILMYCFNFNFIMLISLMGGLFSIMMIYTQVLLKKIIGYSSINHMGWMLMSLMINFNLMIVYFLSYMLINFLLIFILKKFNFIEVNSMMIKFKGVVYNYIILMVLLSLGGLPPLYGFYMKWFFIQEFNKLYNLFLLMMLILYSLMFLFYYFRLMFNFTMLNFIMLNLFMFNKFIYKELNFSLLLYMSLFVTLNMFIFFM
uniref:NADH-ubiquinone oxidoreductase chain 2 n=1 Tax=Psyttalia lounsburyi TaxID=405760 RepID=A0A8A4JCG9_9HYME|nr:NADH dehydrogenase subunit 2 [Psyttalia lounsburyi]